MTNSPQRILTNKVPLITFYFWVIKILSTTVGETGADYLNMDLGLGLNLTTAIMSVIMVVVLAIQMRADRYVPWKYWLVVVFLSIVGTLVTDTLTDELGVSLYLSTTVFSLCLVAVFARWYFSERTLSIHAIDTPRREGYYWLAILFTFALGTAAGDLVAEQSGLGFLTAALIFGGLIALITIGYYVKLLGPVVAFWLAYILTRPLGASLGDLITQSPSRGGWGLGTMPVSGVFLIIILGLVGYLSVTGLDRTVGSTGSRLPAI